MVFEGKSAKHFYGNTAVQYHASRDSTLRIYDQGAPGAILDPPDLIVATQAIVLPEDLLLISDGGYLLGYGLRKGAEFSKAIAKNWSIVSPISCDAAGSACAMAIAISKSDFFDVARETIFKDVALAAVSTRDGSVVFRQPIKKLFSVPSRIELSDLSDIRVAVAPDGGFVGVWHGSVWEVYAVR